MQHRWLANLLTTRWSLRRHFPPAVLDAIEQAIAASEQRHSGELRFAVESAMDLASLARGHTARERAIEAFSRLHVWDTDANNGVLIYLLLAEKDIEIVADRGFNGKVSAQQWQAVCTAMEQAFAEGHYEQGTLAGIEAICVLIRAHFPPKAGDENELPNRPAVL
ncbi:TPM domain-containing protein [Parahaliea mediterranea]|uniref:TPM domain-containing protein n=1 Tax=Parahaliea mediterranea TaxID=651086 RepID=UPI000E2E8629|nr:TPM domain-containing protein [Parahaliea mediterranea]